MPRPGQARLEIAADHMVGAVLGADQPAEDTSARLGTAVRRFGESLPAELTDEGDARPEVVRAAVLLEQAGDLLLRTGADGGGRSDDTMCELVAGRGAPTDGLAGLLVRMLATLHRSARFRDRSQVAELHSLAERWQTEIDDSKALTPDGRQVVRTVLNACVRALRPARLAASTSPLTAEAMWLRRVQAGDPGPVPADGSARGLVAWGLETGMMVPTPVAVDGRRATALVPTPLARMTAHLHAAFWPAPVDGDAVDHGAGE